MVSIRHVRSESPHLGFGLYIVKLIVEYHKGHIEAKNLPSNTGVEFIMTIPALTKH